MKKLLALLLAAMMVLGCVSALADAGSEPDWTEFFAVIAGEGPCNRERLEARRKAWNDGAWFRDGLTAHASKQAARRQAARIAAE